MRIGQIRHGPSAQAGVPAGETAPTRDAGESRALVALAPPAPLREPVARFRQAPFLAQLLALKDQHPQTRERRRAAPHEAIAAYRAGAALTKRR